MEGDYREVWKQGMTQPGPLRKGLLIDQEEQATLWTGRGLEQAGCRPTSQIRSTPWTQLPAQHSLRNP